MACSTRSANSERFASWVERVVEGAVPKLTLEPVPLGHVLDRDEHGVGPLEVDLV